MDRQAAVTWSHQMGLNPFIHKTDSLKTLCFHDTLPISLSLSLPSSKMLSWCFKKSTLTLEVIVHKPRDLVLWSICQNVKLYRFHPCSFGAPWETTLLRSTSKGSQKKVPIPRVIPKNSPTVQWIASKLSRSYSLPSKIQQQQSEPTIVTGSPSLPSGHPPIISCHCHIYPSTTTCHDCFGYQAPLSTFFFFKLSFGAIIIIIIIIIIITIVNIVIMFCNISY